jgi:putative phage-type endonuclease
MGASPRKTPLQLWEEKIGSKQSFYESPAMRRGKDLEAEARKMFEQETGLVVWPNVLIHRQHNYIIASLDGMTMDEKSAVEIKCPGEKTHKMAQEGHIPKHYQIQMQHQLTVTGLNTMFYYSYDGQKGVILEIQRDNVLIEKILARERLFFQSMQTPIPPENERFDLS